MDTKKDKKGQKGTNFFYCKFCDYTTSHKAKYERHVSTLKHQKKANDTKMIQNDTNLSLFSKKGQQEDSNKFICECGKIYKYSSGLYRHKNVCKINKNETDKSNNDRLIIDLLKKMDEKDKQIMELIPKVGNNNTTNNNNQFNLQVFLKEECKDAINWTEFINSIELDLGSLEELKNTDITKGITNIICSKINELGMYKRPIHCIDQKRRKLCIKNEEAWKNEDEQINDLLTKGDRKLQHEYIKLIKQWENDHPNWINDDKLSHEYGEMASKVYQNIDDLRHKNELIKEIGIPK